MKKKDPNVLWIGGALSLLLLAVFFRLQAQASNLLELPIQYLIVSLVPLALGLLVGGYIQEIKLSGVSVSAVDGVLNDSQPIQDPQLVGTKKLQQPSGWPDERAAEYARTHSFMLAHVYKPSPQRGQKFEVSIFLVRHEQGTVTLPRSKFDEVKKVEFFFGDSWGNRIFEAVGDNGFFGVKTHAWGTFLAMGRVTFVDENKAPISLFRYVDFSMAEEQA